MKVPPIRLAATVMLVRRAAVGGAFEVLMLRRSAKSAFAPDVYVFPGGTLEPQDYSREVLARIAGLDDDRLSRVFRAKATSLLDDPAIPPIGGTDRAALVVAALRELFEEGGILLGTASAVPPAPPALQQERRRLLSGESDFAQILEKLNLRLDASGVELFSQWVTPPTQARRFNAHFFVARAGTQAALADHYETHDEVWIEPTAALERYRAGSFAMVYPTVKHVERLTLFWSVDELIGYAKEKTILRIMPAASAENGFTLPAELERAW